MRDCWDLRCLSSAADGRVNTRHSQYRTIAHGKRRPFFFSVYISEEICTTLTTFSRRRRDNSRGLKALPKVPRRPATCTRGWKTWRYCVMKHETRFGGITFGSVLTCADQLQTATRSIQLTRSDAFRARLHRGRQTHVPSPEALKRPCLLLLLSTVGCSCSWAAVGCRLSTVPGDGCPSGGLTFQDLLFFGILDF